MDFRNILAFLFLFLAGCQGDMRSSGSSSPIAGGDMDRQSSSLLLVFWQDYNFADSVVFDDLDASEQKIVDFIAAFPKATEAEVGQAIGFVLEQSHFFPRASSYFRSEFVRYLYDPNSPLRNDFYFQIFLEQVLHLPDLPSADRVRYQMLLDVVKQNQQGTIVNDFKYKTIEGAERSVRDKYNTTFRLLVFYDTDCGHCKEVIQEMKNLQVLQELIAKDVLEVVAVYPYPDEQKWRSYRTAIPSNWINGIDQDVVLEKQLFDLKAFPTLFLLNAEHKVLLKDADLEQVIELLDKQ